MQSANYLATLGLNQQAAQAARDDFNAFMGITQQELQRQSDFKQNILATVFNGFLQQAGLLADAGRVSKSSGGGGTRVGVLA